MNTEEIFQQVLNEACENPLYRFAELVRQDEREQFRNRTPHEHQLIDGQASLLKGKAKKESTLQEISDIGQEAHTDHPMRHWDRTCPACVAEAEKQEPKAWIYEGNLHIFDPTDWAIEPKSVQPLYTAPPKREWVGLTDEKIKDMYNKAINETATVSQFVMFKTFARAIQAKLRERNT